PAKRPQWSYRVEGELITIADLADPRYRIVILDQTKFEDAGSAAIFQRHNDTSSVNASQNEGAARALVCSGVTRSEKAFVSQCAPEAPIGVIFRQKALRYQRTAQFDDAPRPVLALTSRLLRRMCLASVRSKGAPATPTDWQQDGRAKHVVGIIMPLGFDEPFSIATKALRCALRVAPGEHIRISTRKRHGIEGRKSGSRPSLMSLLLGLV